MYLPNKKDGPVGKNDVITTYLSETFFNRAWKGYDNNKMRSKAEREDHHYIILENRSINDPNIIVLFLYFNF